MPLKILLADDSLTAQNLGKKILIDAGYEVIAVSNGAQAMKKIVGERPDLVVLDVYMPGYSGLEICERLRNNRETASIPVLLSVGKMEAFKPEEASRVHAEGVIIKPFEATELVATIKKLAQSLAPISVAKPAAKPVMAEVEPAEEAPPPAEEKLEIQTFQIPREIASSPAFGIDLIPAELQEPESPAGSERAANGLIEFEVERDSEPVTVDPGTRMSSAAGLSGVFEVSPSPAPPAETSVEPPPVEQFERFGHETPATSFGAENTDFIEGANDVPSGEPQAFAGEQQIESVASASDWQSWPEAAPSECHTEHLEAQPEAVAPSSDFQAPQSLPELSSWEEPSSPAGHESSEWSIPEPEATFTPEVSYFAGNAQAESAAEHLSVGSVWVAEETEIEPHESAVSLHEQMQQAMSVSEANEPEPVPVPAETFPAESGEASFQSWGTPERPLEEPGQHAAEPSASEETHAAPEHESFAEPAPEWHSEPQVTEPHAESTDFAYYEASSSEPAAENVAVPDQQQNDFMPGPADPTDHEPEPPTVLPRIIEAPVDPVRIARIVDQLIERLKPELIAAVTRELEHKDS